MSIKLVIADDDELIRESLKIILSYDKIIFKLSLINSSSSAIN